MSFAFWPLKTLDKGRTYRTSRLSITLSDRQKVRQHAPAPCRKELLLLLKLKKIYRIFLVSELQTYNFHIHVITPLFSRSRKQSIIAFS